MDAETRGRRLYAEDGTRRYVGLADAIHLLPTPNASLCNYEEEPETWEVVRRAAAAAKHGNNGIGTPLPIALKLLLTPRGRARESRAATLSPAEADGRYGKPLNGVVASLSSGATTSPPSADGRPSTGLRLNPSFVEWMMGTPSCVECGRSWTDSDCPHSVTAFTSTSADS